MFQTSIERKHLKFIRLKFTDAVKEFDCGDKDLNDFILNRASAFQKYLLAVNYAYVDSDDASKVYAYCSLRLKSYPAVKLCRLGVDISAKGQQIGTTVLDYIKWMFVTENKTGCRFLTVDAYLNAVPFYEKNGFRFMNIEDNDPHTRLMYYDLMDIAN